MKKFYSLAIFAFITSLLLTNAVFGQVTKTWVPTTGGNWLTAGNWNPSGVPGTTDHVLIPANQSGAITRTSSNNETITLKGLTISGNVNFQFDPGSANACTLNITGTLTVDAAKTLTVGINNAGRMNLTLASTGTGTISGTVFINSYTGSGFDRTFTNNGDLSIAATGLITGQNSADFTLATSGTLRIANTAGIAATGTTGAIQSPGTRTFPTAADYEYNGTANQNTGNGLPTNLSGSLTINNPGNTVTLSNAKAIANGGTVNLSNGTFAAGTNLTMSTTSAINRSGGSITGTFQGTGTYDVTYTGASKTTGIELVNGGLRNVIVNLTSGEILTLNASRTPDGSLTISAGTLDLSTFTINRTTAGGTLAVSNGATLKIGGANTLPTNYNTHSIGGSSTIDYAGTTTAQTVAAFNSGQVYGNLTLSGSSAKNFPAARTVNGILSMQGTASATGTSPTYGAASTLEYAGSAAQTSTSVEFPLASGPHSLKINNSNGVTLHAARSISGALTLTNGILTTTTNLLTMNAGSTTSGASNTSFVSGQMAKTGNTAFTFPIGKTGTGYQPVGISAISASTTFTAEYIRASGGAKGGVTSPLQGVSACEHWMLYASSIVSADVTLYWNANSGCGSAGYINGPFPNPFLRIARYNGASGSLWVNASNTNSQDPANSVTAGNMTATLASSALTNPTFFTFGTTNTANSPLPVMYANVKAYAKNNGVQIEWSNLTERDLIGYDVERSANGTNFTAINHQQPKNNLNDKADYTEFDAAPLQGTNYYRIKASETSGKIIYSKILRVEIGNTTKLKFTMYPNPVTGNQVTIGLNNVKAGQYTLRVVNATGQDVLKQTITSPGSSMTEAIQLPASVKPGVYTILISGDNFRESKAFVVQ